jgi:hypothetical protein
VRAKLVPAALGSLAAAVLVALIFVGSRGLRNFDSALVGYAIAIVFLGLGVVYRYVVWVSAPPARRYLVHGWRSFFSVRNFMRNPTFVPREIVSYLSLQTFMAKRGVGRWVAHQALFWGVVLALAITFPLVFGWIHFRAVPGVDVAYRMYVWDQPTFTFDPLSLIGWVIFHGLDISAVLVIAGSAYFVWRRVRDREATTGQRVGYDFIPLIGLIAISVTGLLLTFSSIFLEGRGYEFLTITHMITVVLTLVYIPFGKFFHVIQRPAQIGVGVFKRSTLERDGAAACQRCGEPVDSSAALRNLQGTMDDLGLRFSEWSATCPRCRRLGRGEAYLRDVKGGFRT